MNILGNKFRGDLERLLNFHSIDAYANVPDYILANYLIDCLSAIKSVVNLADVHKPKELPNDTESI